jgi:hypothetical protein
MSKHVTRKRSETEQKGAAASIKRDEITTFPPSAHLMPVSHALELLVSLHAS